MLGEITLNTLVNTKKVTSSCLTLSVTLTGLVMLRRPTTLHPSCYVIGSEGFQLTWFCQSSP